VFEMSAMEKKVTSYRLSIDVLEKLDKLVQQQNEYSRDLAAEHGFKFSKYTKAEYLEMLINERYVEMLEIEKK
jgi:hypothetical protein